MRTQPFFVNHHSIYRVHFAKISQNFDIPMQTTFCTVLKEHAVLCLAHQVVCFKGRSVGGRRLPIAAVSLTRLVGSERQDDTDIANMASSNRILYVGM